MMSSSIAIIGGHKGVAGRRHEGHDDPPALGRESGMSEDRVSGGEPAPRCRDRL